MYFLNFFPLEEQYLNSAKKDELVVDPRTGHITICTTAGTDFASSSKTLEAEINGLLSLKDRYYNEYILVSDELEEIVKRLQECKNSINDILNTIIACTDKLTEINGYANTLLNDYDLKYKAYNRYLYTDMTPFRSIVAQNVKRVIILENTIDEMMLLSQDIEEIREDNKAKLQEVARTIGMTLEGDDN